MNYLTKVAILFLFICCYFPLVLGVHKVEAGAWAMKKGGMYNRVSFNYYESNRIYDNSGDSRSMPNHGRFYDRNLSWYEEYGMLDSVTLLSSVYYKWLSYHDDYVHNRSQGIGDLEVGVKYNFLKNPIVLSIQGLIKYGELYGSEDPEIGDGQNDYEVRILAGKSLWPFPGYAGLEIGYRFRTGAPSDEVRYLVELGMSFTPKFYGRIKLDGIWGMGNADTRDKAPDIPSGEGGTLDDLLNASLRDASASSPEENIQASGVTRTVSVDSNPSIAPEYDLIKLDITLGFSLNRHFGVEAQYTPIIYGERIGKGWTSSLALVYQW